MPVHFAERNTLEQNDPATREALNPWEFAVAKSKVPFICLFTDKTFELEVKVGFLD